MDSDSFTQAVKYLKDVLNGIDKTRSQDAASTRNLYRALGEVQTTAKTAEQGELSANSNLNVFEEILCSKYTVLNRSMQVLLASVYEVLLAGTPGYVARNIVNALLGVCNNKATSSGCKECAVMVIGKVMEKRSSDLGSSISEAVHCLSRLVRNMDLTVRVAAAQALIDLVMGAGSRVSDCHVELVKLGSKLSTDKSIDIRQKAALLLSEIGRNSGGFTSITCDVLLNPISKGLEDEASAVQDSFAQAAAALYLEQIHVHAAEQEQAKIGMARGGSAPEENDNTPSKSKRQSSMLRLKEMAAISPSPQKAPEVLDFKTVVGGIMKHLARASNSNIRAGYASVLYHLCSEVSSTLQEDSLQWLIESLIMLLRDSQVMSLPYEEIVYFRSRLAHVIRRGITARLTESNQLLLAHHMIDFFSNSKEKDAQRNEHELQLGLGELGVVVASLGEASTAVFEDIKSLAIGQLRNSNFGVRAAAAHLLVSMAIVLPAVGATFLADALNGANIQVKQMLSFTAADFSSDGKDDENEESSDNAAKKKMSPKEAERLQRMFYFHGYALVISVFLKSERRIPTGLPLDLITQAFDFGLEILTLDIQAAPLQMRHVVCSIIRAGSLIVSSSLSMGYSIAKLRIPRLLGCCNTLLKPCSQPASQSSSATAGQELLYELMSVEAALVCISTLLWFCPESLMNDENCLVTIVDGLENAFRAIKTKYQSKFRSHFRFRTLHVILLECFSWLPPGSFPSTCPQLFVEALRVFRDSITSGFECTCLNDFVPPDHSILHTFGMARASSGYSFNDPPTSENLMIMRLEQHSVALQKKESEAFLMCFSNDAALGSEFQRTPLHASDWMEPSPPCAFIDSRTIDASISLIAATFGHQSNDYQEKAIQLCSQAISQYIKGSSSLGLFTSTEDKIRKDKKNYISLKNVTAVLSAIIRSFPFHNGMSLEMDLQWVQTVADIMFDTLSYPYAEIRSASSTALGTFCSKIFGAQLMDSMGMKITQALRTSVDKKGEVLGELSGHLLAISSLSLNATNLPGVQSNIATIIFDTLKRTDSSLHFRAHGVFAMSTMLKTRALINQECFDMNATMQLLDKVMQVLEVHLLYGSTPNDSAAIYEYDLLLVCLQRLANVATSLLLEVDPTSEHLHSLVKIWSIIHKASSNPSVQHECAEFIVVGSVVLLSCNALDIFETTQYVHKWLTNPWLCTTEHLQKLVQCVRVLAAKDSDILCESGLDITLFHLLDWCVACTTGRKSSHYWGVELRSGVQHVIHNYQSLQRDVESTLEFLVEVNVQISPKNRATHWVLLCRAIALGLKTSSGGGNNDNEEDEEKADPTGEEGEWDEGKDQVRNRSIENVQFLNWCRDQAVEKAFSLTSNRSRLKYMALRCASTATVAAGEQNFAAQSDLMLARKITRRMLDELNTLTPDDAQLWGLDCYMPLFLHDFVSLACACAAFSIEDQRLLSLQSVSMQFLQAIVNIFWSSSDPDHSHSDADTSTASLQSTYSSKLLMQFMAQIISAVRSCLSAKYSPQLQWTTGSLVFDFIRGGLAHDKVVVRRLAKALQSSFEEFGSAQSNNEKKESIEIPLRTPKSEDVASKVACIQDVIHMSNFARLFLLTTPFGYEFGDVSAEVRNAVDGLTSAQVPAVTKKWVAMATDAARVLQTQGSPWPAETSDTSCRRGGITYDPTIDPGILRSHLELALPYVVAASAASPALKNDDVELLFSLGQVYLMYLHQHYKSDKQARSSPGCDSSMIKNSKLSLELVLLYLFTSIAKSSSFFAKIPIGEWIDLLRNLSDIMHEMNAKRKTAKSEVGSAFYLLTANLISYVTLHAFNSEGKGQSGAEDDKTSAKNLSKALWECLVVCMSGVFEGIVVFSDALPVRQRYPTILSAAELSQLDAVLDDKSIKAAVSLFESGSTLVKNSCESASNVYWSHLLVNLIPCTALRCKSSSMSELAINSIIPSLRSMVDCGLGQDISRWIAETLWLWHTGAATAHSNIEIVVDSLFKCWVEVTAAQMKQNKTVECSPHHLTAAILARDTSMHFLHSLVSSSLSFLQKQTQQKVHEVEFVSGFCEIRLVMTAVVPCLLTRLSSSPSDSGFSEVNKTAVQLIFAIFNVIPEDPPRQAYLQSLLAPTCDICSRRGEFDEVSSMFGKGITHIARTQPHLFREEISRMSSEQSQILQNLMRVALQNIQAQNTQSSSVSQGSSTATAGVKKIDLSKWNKK